MRILIETIDEDGRKGQFQRIFPSTTSHRYLKYLEQPRYYNLLLDAWCHKYHKYESRGKLRDSKSRRPTFEKLGTALFCLCLERLRVAILTVCGRSHQLSCMMPDQFVSPIKFDWRCNVNIFVFAVNPFSVKSQFVKSQSAFANFKFNGCFASGPWQKEESCHKHPVCAQLDLCCTWKPDYGSL
jgi:hypothetical protein